MASPAPILLVLPQGLTVTGVTTWALRLAGALIARGRPVAILVHGDLDDHREMDCPIPEGVRLFRADDLPPIGSTEGNLAPFLPHYRFAAQSMAGDAGRPCVLVPTRHGDCFGACAQLTREFPSDVRLVGWQHLDSAYENAVVARYERACAKLAGVSSHIACLLARRFGARRSDILAIHNGVDTPSEPPKRKPLAGRPLRLIYTGRLEHEQKRVLALVELSAALSRRGVDHRLVIVGDGPALARLQAIAETNENIRIVPGVPPHAIACRLDQADVFVLASRREGMSVSLLEAMARGCAPVITRTASGAGEVVEPGKTGELIDFDETTTDEALASALADGIGRVLAAGVHEVGQAAWNRVRTTFSLEAQGERTERLIEAAAGAPARSWPEDVNPAFSAPGLGSGAVPPDAGDRLAALLAGLSGRKVLIHGAGAHTRALHEHIAAASEQIVGVCDDDPELSGREVAGLPVIEPKHAGGAGATDVVISSWLHEESIWARREVFERQGLRVHRLYAD
ncbi:MAG: glycosyltransferase [Phycisphaerales bacterium]